MAPEVGLRLRAEDAEDLSVISACLQDALVAVRDLAFDRDQRQFVLVANRFRWETGPAHASETAAFERILCGIAFDDIEGVLYRGFYRSEEDRILSLLAIRTTPDPVAAPAGVAIDLEFSGGATIRLNASAIRCHARDLGDSWPTSWRPDHEG